ncbi:MAG: hypothetical protein FWD01_01490, partial [Defluviitaleaceae bacterium]|nr:hypothetical protein [Defluviitaleaceae bacterium]
MLKSKFGKNVIKRTMAFLLAFTMVSSGFNRGVSAETLDFDTITSQTEAGTDEAYGDNTENDTTNNEENELQLEGGANSGTNNEEEDSSEQEENEEESNIEDDSENDEADENIDDEDSSETSPQDESGDDDVQDDDEEIDDEADEPHDTATQDNNNELNADKTVQDNPNANLNTEQVAGGNTGNATGGGSTSFYEPYFIADIDGQMILTIIDSSSLVFAMEYFLGQYEAIQINSDIEIYGAITIPAYQSITIRSFGSIITAQDVIIETGARLFLENTTIMVNGVAFDPFLMSDNTEAPIMRDIEFSVTGPGEIYFALQQNDDSPYNTLTDWISETTGTFAIDEDEQREILINLRSQDDTETGVKIVYTFEDGGQEEIEFSVSNEGDSHIAPEAAKLTHIEVR